MGKQQSISAEQALLEAEKAAKKGDKEKAMKYYEAVLVKHPDHQEAMDGVRRLHPNTLFRTDTDELEQLFKEQKFREVEVKAKVYLERYTEVYELVSVLGASLVALKKPEEAMGYLEKALEFRPFCIKSHYFMATAYKMLGSSQLAIKSYLKTIEINKKYIPAYIELGNIFMSLKDFDSAAETFQEALKIEPDAFDLLWYAGRVFWSKGELANAIEHMEKAAKIDGKKLELQLELARCYHLNGENDKARGVYEGLVGEVQHPAIYNNFGNFLVEMDDLDGAVKQFIKAIETDPAYITAYTNLSKTYVTMGEDEKAMDIDDKARELLPPMAQN